MMLELALGIVIFFGTHSVSIFALETRDRLAAANEKAWKVGYSVASLLGIVLMIRGYGDFRATAPVLYVAPAWLYYVAAVLLLPSFILFFAPYFPGRIKVAAKHPQLVAVKLWAVAHLLVNGSLADVMLFGTFLAWAVADRISMKRRTQRPLPGMPQSTINDVILVVLGLTVYAAMVLWLHEAWFGVRPLI